MLGFAAGDKPRGRFWLNDEPGKRDSSERNVHYAKLA